MPLFLLHDIFPKGPGAGWFFLAVLIVGLLSLVSKVLFGFGLVVAVARGRERLGPLDLRGVKPPSLGVWLVAFILCAIAATLHAVEPLAWIPALVLHAGAGMAGNLSDELLPMLVVACLVSSLHWTIVLTGARALLAMRRRRPVRDGSVVART